MRADLVALAAAALLATGCNPPSDIEPLACRNEDPGVAALGMGDLDKGFTPVEEGDTLPLVFGPQGMHMVVLSVQVDNLEASAVSGLGNEVAIGLYQDDEVVGGTKGDMVPVAGSEDVAEFLGIRAIITAAEVEEFGNQVAYVEATVVDGCGRELTDGMVLWLQL